MVRDNLLDFLDEIRAGQLPKKENLKGKDTAGIPKKEGH